MKVQGLLLGLQGAVQPDFAPDTALDLEVDGDEGDEGGSLGIEQGCHGVVGAEDMSDRMSRKRKRPT